MDDGSNTTQKQPGGITGKGFVKGDPRINRKGRPKSFDALRALAQQIASETASDKDGTPAEINGHIATNVEIILRAMMKDKRTAQQFLEIAFGKVPSQLDVTSGGEKLSRLTQVIEGIPEDSI